MKIIAHRGHAKLYPENTLIAFQKAVEAGADGIELDVHFTTDKKVIVHHYYALGHTDNGEGLIFQKDSAYLRSLDGGSWFHESFTGTRMPFLDEVVAEFGNKTHYEVELKTGDKEYVEEILKTVNRYDLLSNVQFTSYQYPLLAFLKSREPRASIGFIAPPKPEWMDMSTFYEVIRSNLITDTVNVLHMPNGYYTKEFVNELHERNIRAHFGLCDTENAVKNALNSEADELTTNNLELALKSIRE